MSEQSEDLTNPNERRERIAKLCWRGGGSTWFIPGMRLASTRPARCGCFGERNSTIC